MYARGFCRSYADFLGLDGPRLLQELDASPRSDFSPPEERRVSGRERASGRGKIALGLLLLALGAGLLLTAREFFRRRPAPVPPVAESPPAPVAPPEALSAPPEAPAAPAPPQAPETPTPSAPPETPSALVPLGREGSRLFFRLPPGEFTLGGEFSSPCWLRVEADGRKVFGGTIPAGGRGEWKASRRLVVRVGYPPAASFRIGEKLLLLPSEKKPLDLVISAGSE